MSEENRVAEPIQSGMFRVFCPNPECKDENQAVAVARVGGSGIMDEQTITCKKCGKEFSVQVPYRILLENE